MQLRQRRLFGLCHRQAFERRWQGAGDDRAGTGQKAAHRLDIAGQIFQRIFQREQAADLPRRGQEIVRFSRIFGKIDLGLCIEQANARPSAKAFGRRRSERFAGKGLTEAKVRGGEKRAFRRGLSGRGAGGGIRLRTGGQRAKVCRIRRRSSGSAWARNRVSWRSCQRARNGKQGSRPSPSARRMSEASQSSRSRLNRAA